SFVFVPPLPPTSVLFPYTTLFRSPLALARLDVTLSTPDLIVPSDDGLWPQIRSGLSVSFKALSWSLAFVIIGVCAVLPWVLIIYGVYRLLRRLFRRPVAVTTAA